MSSFRTRHTRQLTVLLILGLFYSCQKMQLAPNTNSILEKNKITQEFFTTSDAIEPIISRVYNEIKQRNSLHEFVSEFAKSNGFPRWNGSLIKVVGDRDTIVIVPLVLRNLKYTNGFIKVVLNKNISISSHLRSEYNNYPFGANDSFNAENYITIFAYFDNALFNFKQFLITDSRLFRGHPLHSSNDDRRMIKISRVSSENPPYLRTQGCGYLTVYIDWLEQDVENCTCNDPLNCDWQTGCSDCSNFHTTSHTTYVDCGGGDGSGGGSTGDGTWNPNPPPGGGGGGSSNGGGSPLTPIELIPGGDLTEAQINLMTQLNAIRQPGDHYYFDNQLSAQNSLSFSSVAEFSQFLASAGITGTTISSTIINQNEKIEHGKFNLTFIGGVDVSCKLSKVGNLWQLGNVTSSEYGVTFGWSWSQSDFAYSTNGNEISLTVEGYVNYNVIVEAIGTVYKQKMKFIIKINNQTGAITSLSKG